MDIHAPDKPVHSWKEFAVHIAIVTVGILIALGLDGLREHFRERRLVRETREAVHYEMVADEEHAGHELKAVTLYRQDLKSIVDALPGALQTHPEQVIAKLNEQQNPEYFMSATSWQAALSTGALAHMRTDEVSAYADVAEGIGNYSKIQIDAVHQEAETKAFFAAYPHPTGEQLATGIEKLMLLYKAEDSLAFVCPQMKDDIDRALRASQ